MPLVRTFAEVFSQRWVLGVAGVASTMIFAFSMWLRNFNLILATFNSPLFSISDNLLLLLHLLGGITTDATPLAATLILATSLLFGMNAGLFAYYVWHKRNLPRVTGETTMFGGLIAAVFGVGCASCGTFVLGAALSSVGASSVLALLPLGGQEFLLVSVVLLLVSIYSLGRSLEASNVCAIPHH